MKITPFKFIRLSLAFLMGMAIIACSKPKKFDSHIICVSENGYGVLVTKIIPHDTPEVPSYVTKDSILVKSSIPGRYDLTTSLSSSDQIPQSKLPNYLTFEFQYMELSDCRNSSESKLVKLIYEMDYHPFEKGDVREVSQEEADFYLIKGKGKIATLASMAGKEKNLDEILVQYEDELKTSKVFKINSGCKTWTAIDSLKFIKTVDLSPYKKTKEITRFGKRNTSASGSYYGTRITYQFYDQGEIKLSLENYTTNPFK